MKVAVTGASGFIGRHVLELLGARDDFEIVAASRTPMPEAALPAGCRHVSLDIADAAAVEASFERLGRPDTVIHLAWAGLPNYKSLHHFETQLPRQYAFLKALVDGGLRSLTCTGTCFEYGMRSGALSEDMPTLPSNPYGFAKDALRQQLEFLRASRPFSLNWARLFYMFGSGQPGGSLYPLLHAAMERGDRRFAMSGGEQLRDFLHVTEVARIIVALAVDLPDVGVVNVCSGKPVSVRSLVERWRNERGSHIELDLGKYPYPDYEPMAFWGSAVKLHRVLPEAGLIP